MKSHEQFYARLLSIQVSNSFEPQFAEGPLWAWCSRKNIEPWKLLPWPLRKELSISTFLLRFFQWMESSVIDIDHLRPLFSDFLPLTWLCALSMIECRWRVSWGAADVTWPAHAQCMGADASHREFDNQSRTNTSGDVDFTRFSIDRVMKCCIYLLAIFVEAEKMTRRWLWKALLIQVRPKRLQAWWEWNLQQYLGHQAEMGQIGDILVSMGYCWMHLVEWCQEIHQICSHPFHSFSKDCFRCPQPQQNQSALREICDRFLKGYGLSLLNLVICHKRSCGHGWCDKKKRSTAWKHVRFNYFQSVAFWW